MVVLPPSGGHSLSWSRDCGGSFSDPSQCEVPMLRLSGTLAWASETTIDHHVKEHKLLTGLE